MKNWHLPIFFFVSVKLFDKMTKNLLKYLKYKIGGMNDKKNKFI